MSELKRVIILADLLAEQIRRQEDLEEQLKSTKAARQKLENEDLPTLMAEIGLSEFKLEDGSVVAIKEDVQCGISEARRAVALRWLVENNFGGIIKSEVRVAFESSQHDTAEEFAKSLAETFGSAVNFQEAVHPATLKSFVKERLAQGEDIPFDLFGIHPFSVAKITLPKAKKGSK